MFFTIQDLKKIKKKDQNQAKYKKVWVERERVFVGSHVADTTKSTLAREGLGRRFLSRKNEITSVMLFNV